METRRRGAAKAAALTRDAILSNMDMLGLIFSHLLSFRSLKIVAGTCRVWRKTAFRIHGWRVLEVTASIEPALMRGRRRWQPFQGGPQFVAALPPCADGHPLCADDGHQKISGCAALFLGEKERRLAPPWVDARNQLGMHLISTADGRVVSSKMLDVDLGHDPSDVAVQFAAPTHGRANPRLFVAHSRGSGIVEQEFACIELRAHGPELADMECVRLPCRAASFQVGADCLLLIAPDGLLIAS
jgi:hypothetical protein